VSNVPYLEIDDLSMFYKISGDGRPVLLIHGLGSDNRSWEYQEDELKNHFQLVMPDLRGHGLSEGGISDFVPAQRFAEDLNALLSHLDIDRTHVVGESMGGIVALEFALDFPQRLNKLVLVDTTPRVTEETADVVYGWREAQLAGGDDAYFWANVRSCFTPEWIVKNPSTIEHLRQRAQSLNPEGAVAAGLGLISTDLTNRLSDINAETLIVHGDKDEIINIEMGRIINRGIKGSKLKVLNGSGHVPTVQKTKEFNRLLTSFLRN
jgi:pimeloyl-ACP methyl ester carboxylesterase